MRKNLKFIILLLIAVFSFMLVACKEKTPVSDINQEQVDYVVQYIEELPSVASLKYEEDILYGKELYDGLSEKEKALVTNYDVLTSLLAKLDYLRVEDSYIINAMEETKSNLKKIIPTKVEANVFSITFDKVTNYENEYKSYTFQIKWETSDPVTINVETGKVSHDLIERVVTLTATISCIDVKDTVVFTRNVTVEEAEMRNLKTEKVVGAYYFGSYVPFTDLDLETINIVYYCFADIEYKLNGEEKEYYVSTKGLSLLTRLQELREKGIRLIFSIGGWHDDSSYWKTYSDAAASETARQQIANSILEICQEYHLDGVDMDWEYPDTKDKANFTLLMQTISQTLKAVSKNYIISAAVPCDSWVTNRYNFGDLNKCMDYINIMNYDQELQNETSHHAYFQAAINFVKTLKTAGLNYEKMVLGAAFYGKVYSNVPATNNGLGQKSKVGENLTFTSIYKKYISRIGNGVTRYYDEAKKAYYLYDATNSEFVTYDDPDSVSMKYTYAVDNGLAGIMFWSFNEDTTDTLISAIANAKQAANK